MNDVIEVWASVFLSGGIEHVGYILPFLIFLIYLELLTLIGSVKRHVVCKCSNVKRTWSACNNTVLNSVSCALFFWLVLILAGRGQPHGSTNESMLKVLEQFYSA